MTAASPFRIIKGGPRSTGVQTPIAAYYHFTLTKLNHFIIFQFEQKKLSPYPPPRGPRRGGLREAKKNNLAVEWREASCAVFEYI